MTNHRFSWIIFGLMIVALVIVLFGFGAQTSAGRTTAESKPPPRFEYESVSTGVGLSLYVVTDRHSGKKYLVNYNGGIIEIVP